MENKKIYLTQEGYEQFMKELQELRDSLKNNGKNKSDAFVSAVGDGWHDNFAFEEAKREELRIQGEIERKLEQMRLIEIIDASATNSKINIDDYIDVEMIYGDDEPENMIFKLVGLSTPNTRAEIPEISLNSPLGNAVYEKNIGDRVSYSVNANKIEVLINNKSSNVNDLISKQKVKRI